MLDDEKYIYHNELLRALRLHIFKRFLKHVEMSHHPYFYLW
jgi:hypothetical protein